MHIFLPHEIIEVDAVGDGLIVVARPYMEEEAFSFALNTKSALPSVAKNAGLPVTQYAASKIRCAKDEQQREDQRLNTLPQAFCHEPPPSLEDQSISVTRNRIFIVFPIMAAALFAAMVYHGHDRGPGHIAHCNHPAEASRQPHKQS
jgi:hypothetical protein